MTIIGSGQMGSGIAQVTAAQGINVTLVDLDQVALDRAVATVDKSLSRVVKKKFTDPVAGEAFKNEILSNINTSVSASDAVKNTDLVLEAIVENLEIKQKLFAELDAAAPASAIFASNTSSLSIKDIAKTCSADRQANFGGLHFFNPVPMMKLLEVVRVTDMTSEDTFEKLLAYGQKIKKTTVKCQDTPGFLVNRLLVPYLFEAIRLYERGHGSKEDIDVAMKLGAGHPMGPFQLADYVGLDTCKFIVDGWKKEDPGNSLFNNSEMLDKLVAEGKLGVKSGEGFFNYKK